MHIPHGIFAADGGWELVGAIAALLLVLAAAGPGRWSVDRAILSRQGSIPALEPAPSATTSAPPPQLPSSTPTLADVPVLAPSTDPLPFHGRRSPISE